MTQRISAQQPAKTAWIALCVQIAACLVTAALVAMAFQIDRVLPLTWLYVAVIEGLIAAGLSWRLHQPHWWCWVHIGFAPLLVLVLAWQIPQWVYLIGFIGLVLIYWTTFRTRVPFFLTNQKTIEALRTIIQEHRPHRMLDLGCASGGLLHILAKQFPNSVFFGFEIAPLPVLLAKWRLRGLLNASVCFQDFWRADFSEFDLIYAFLSDEPMAQLWDKVRQEMRPGAIFISNTFAVPNQQPDKRIAVDDFRGTELLVYHIKAHTIKAKADTLRQADAADRVHVSDGSEQPDTAILNKT